MRAAVLTDPSQPPAPAEFEEPRAGAGQVVVEVEAAGLNPVDLAIASGAFAGPPPLPCALGREGIGRTPDGRRVYFDSALLPHGSFAERCLLSEDALIEVPEEIDAAAALPFGIAGLAAWLGLGWRGGLRDGETVIVLGSSSVVGQIALQAARRMGAGRIVAAARDERHLARAGELGADAAVRIQGGVEQLGEALREACGEGGADLVLDPLWGEPALAAIAALRSRGRLVQIGNSAAPALELPARPLRMRGLSVLAHINFAAPLAERAAAFRRMCELSLGGELVVEVEEVPLDDVADAWRRQAGGPHRKLVIRP